MVHQVHRLLRHALGVAGGAHAPAFAGEGNEVVMATVFTLGSGKAVRKRCLIQGTCERLGKHRPLGCSSRPAVNLACAGEIKQSLKVFGNRLIQQRALGLAAFVQRFPRGF